MLASPRLPPTFSSVSASTGHVDEFFVIGGFPQLPPSHLYRSPCWHNRIYFCRVTHHTRGATSRARARFEEGEKERPEPHEQCWSEWHRIELLHERSHIDKSCLPDGRRYFLASQSLPHPEGQARCFLSPPPSASSFSSLSASCFPDFVPADDSPPLLLVAVGGICDKNCSERGFSASPIVACGTVIKRRQLRHQHQLSSSHQQQQQEERGGDVDAASLGLRVATSEVFIARIYSAPHTHTTRETANQWRRIRVANPMLRGCLHAELFALGANRVLLVGGERFGMAMATHGDATCCEDELWMLSHVHWPEHEQCEEEEEGGVGSGAGCAPAAFWTRLVARNFYSSWRRVIPFPSVSQVVWVDSRHKLVSDYGLRNDDEVEAEMVVEEPLLLQICIESESSPSSSSSSSEESQHSHHRPQQQQPPPPQLLHNQLILHAVPLAQIIRKIASSASSTSSQTTYNILEFDWLRPRQALQYSSAEFCKQEMLGDARLFLARDRLFLALPTIRRCDITAGSAPRRLLHTSQQQRQRQREVRAAMSAILSQVFFPFHMHLLTPNFESLEAMLLQHQEAGGGGGGGEGEKRNAPSPIEVSLFQLKPACRKFSVN